MPCNDTLTKKYICDKRLRELVKFNLFLKNVRPQNTTKKPFSCLKHGTQTLIIFKAKFYVWGRSTCTHVSFCAVPLIK